MMDLTFFPKNISGKLFLTYLNMPEHPAKIRIENMIGSLFFKKGIRVTNKDGLLLHLEANDWMTRIIIEEKCYEGQSIRLAQNILSKGGVFFDIGANFGLYSCILSKQEGVKTFSFEPNYDVVGNLIRNIRLNGIASNARVVNSAVSDKSRLVNFTVPNEGNKGTARYEAGQPVGDSRGYYVSTISLEDAIEYLQVPYITLIKIDIEGNEMDVFRAFDFKKTTVHNIIMEFKDSATISLGELKSFFGDRGYTVKNILGQPVNSDEDILEYNVWLEKTNA